jgi:hypothetical protein
MYKYHHIIAFFMAWRDNLDPKIKEHFEDLIKETAREENAYRSASKPSKAQLWTALAILNKRISDLELELKNLKKPKKSSSKLKKSLEKL